MARPPAEILISTNVTDLFAVDVMAAKSLYAVFYLDRPINVKHKFWSHRGEIKKYVRSVFPTKKAAENLAEKLNNYFSSNDFTAVKVV